jgi:hypothetical protein
VKYFHPIFILIVIFTTISCNDHKNNQSEVNTSHLDYLYEEIEVDGTDMAIIHIYSNYPSYKYIDDEDEGTACIDDAARAAIFYLNNYNYTANTESIKKNKKLLEFILYLQAENGFFYNFIWSDYSINKEFKTSVAEPNWWSWRALWVLTESYPYYKSVDHNFAEKINASIEKLVIAIKNQIPNEIVSENINGLNFPTWLPRKYASDQAAVLLLGLTNYYDYTQDQEIYDYIELLCHGIMQMQVVDANCKYYGAFLSWQYYWHAWGNNQSYALLKSYKLLKDEKILLSALTELNNFYPTIKNMGYNSSFSVSKIDEIIETENEKKYSQIAYNFRPMVYALFEAYKITNEDKYVVLAGKIGRWFTGDNPVGSKMYNHENGIVFDGIESEQIVNMNSGAESTIEALLSILEIKNNKLAHEAFKIE